MAAQMMPEPTPGTAVATTKPALPAEFQAAIAERKMRNAAVAAIRGTQWGATLSDQTARAIADYADRAGVDAATELEVLGGRLYKTSAYYRRKGAELIAAGVIENITPDHIEHDPRLDEAHATAAALAEDAQKTGDEEEATYWRGQARAVKREKHRRQMERIRWGAPEKAAAIVVTKIVVRGMPRPVEGCNWCGNGVRQRDPVGDAEPSKTAETRSERRAWIKLVTGEAAKRVPALAAFARAEGTSGEAAVEAVLVAEAETIAAGHRAALPAPLATVGRDEYEPETIVVSPPTPGQDAAAAHHAAQPDPYGHDDAPAGAELALGDAPKVKARRNAIAEGR